MNGLLCYGDSRVYSRTCAVPSWCVDVWGGEGCQQGYFSSEYFSETVRIAWILDDACGTVDSIGYEFEYCCRVNVLCP